MKIIAKYIGGSKSYGLSTPTSDVDVRFLFINTEVGKIIGLDRHEHEIKQDSTEDSQGFELRKFLGLLRRGNSQCQELLFNTNWQEKSREFEWIQTQRFGLIDSEKIYETLLGYGYSEEKQVFGEKTGQLGAKRKESIEKYGYSYRNAVHCLRLLRTGAIFFNTDEYPINIVESDKVLGDKILKIKTQPESFTIIEIREAIFYAKEELDKAFAGRRKNYVFQTALANEICRSIYLPYLAK